MNRKPYVFRTPLLILLVLVIALILLVKVGLPMWAAHKESIAQIPKSGTFTCDALSVSISFGKHTVVTLPDGTTEEATIDYGRRLRAGTGITGWYEAHLEDGYIEIRFTELSIPFDPDCSYQFMGR